MSPSGRKWEKLEMFFGSYFHNLDDKNRLCLPSKLRQKLVDKVYILKGYDGCISLFGEESFQKYVEGLSTLSFANHLSRDVERIALSSVYELEIDKANRVQIPTALVEKYAITKEVVVLGLINHIEIWSKDKWEKYLLDNEKDFEEKSEELLKTNDK